MVMGAIAGLSFRMRYLLPLPAKYGISRHARYAERKARDVGMIYFEVIVKYHSSCGVFSMGPYNKASTRQGMSLTLAACSRFLSASARLLGVIIAFALAFK